MSFSEFSNGKITLIENLGVGTESISLQVPSLVSSYTITFPLDVGNSFQVLKNSSTPGILEWETISGSWKEKVSAASVGDVVLSPSPALIDDVILTEGKRVLLKDQTTTTENGIYKYSSGDLVRTSDALDNLDASGTVVYVTGGSTNKDKIYFCTNGSGSLFNSGISFDELNIKKVLTGPDNSTDNAVARFDGTTSGDITGANDINTTNLTASNNVQGVTVTDGTASLNSGSFSGLVNVTASGTITISPLPDDSVLFIDNSGQVTSAAGFTWDGTSLSATEVNTQTITRPNGANQSSLWTSGVGNIDIGLQTTGTIQLGSGPMFKLTSTTSILQSSLTIQGNLSRQYIDTTINTASNVTYTAQEVFNGIIFRDCNGADRTDTLPTAAALVAVVPEPVVGSSMEVLVQNTTVGLNLLTLQANTGVTLNESLTIAAGITNRFLIVFDNVSGGTEAVTVFASVPKDRVILQCSFTDPTQGGNSTRYAQWGPDTGDNGLVDATVLGFSGKIVQVVASYSDSTSIGIGGGASLSFSVGTANATLSTFTPFTGGTNVIVWNNTFNNTYPSTSSGSLSIPVTATDRIALRSTESGNVSPTSFQVRCAITFQLD